MGISTYPQPQPRTPMDDVQREAKLLTFFPPAARRPAVHALLGHLIAALDAKAGKAS